MGKYLLILLLLLSVQCRAGQNILSSSLSWLKSALPEQTQLSFNKDKIKFEGCRHKEYELLLTQALTRNLFIESSLSYASGKLNWGVYQQKVSARQWSFVPRYQFSEKVNVGFGIKVQAAPEFKTSQGVDIDLPKNKTFLASTRVKGFAEKHYIEITISSRQWVATNINGTWFEKGASDNKLNISYQAYF